MTKTDSITIVGGGSAGWMSAAILVKSFPDKLITVIEDPDTPPIGVGESTYDGIKFYCEYLGIDEESFFKYTDASLKLGLVFSNFYKKEGYKPFMFPFGAPYLEDTKWGLEDWLIKKSIYKDTPVEEFAESYFPHAHLAKHGRFSENKNNKLGNFNPKLEAALHFDAIKFGGWLRDEYCLPRGVKLIKAKVVNADIENSSIKSLILDTEEIVSSDLYVDCTGFKSLLLGSYLEEPFISYNDVLPNNRAWATQIQYEDKEKELKPVTTCTAIENGWCWDIPLWSRLGSGYVYSDKYVSPEDAKEEFKKYLMSDNMAVPRTREQVDSLDYKDINMRVGIHDRTWVGNVVAIGLSAGFIEPLESNGLFTVHDFLYQLVRALSRGEVSQWDKDVYNDATRQTYDGFAEFIRLHYALSLRDDTEYWKSNVERSFDFSGYNLSNEYANQLHKVKTAKTKHFGVPPTGITWISSGMNYHLLDDVSVRLGEIGNRANYRIDLDPAFKYLNAKRENWNEEALKSPTLYSYLKEKYHAE